MSQHPNARLTPGGREALASRVAGGERVSAVARQMGVSRQTASKWLSRAPRRAAVRPVEQAAQARQGHPSRGRGGGLRGALLHAPGPGRARRRDGRACPHLREDRCPLGAAEARRRRPRDRGGPAPRARRARALREVAPGRARARGRQEGGEDTGGRRLEGPGAGQRPLQGALGPRLVVPSRRRGRLQPRRLR